MLLAGLTFAALAAVLHVYIFALESLSWTSPRTRAVFGTTAEEAETTKALAFNQGFYNLFLAIVTVVGIAAVALDHNTVGLALIFMRRGFHAGRGTGSGDVVAGQGPRRRRPGCLPSGCGRTAGAEPVTRGAGIDVPGAALDVPDVSIVG